MLEMAPYRHYINPAFEPITDGYFYIPVLSHLQLYAGNNSLSMSSLIINQGGKTMWTLNPESNVNLLDEFRPNTLIRTQIQAPILGFGTRLKIGNYPIVNVYANVHIKHTRFFVMMSHINAGQGDKNYFFAPHYPMNIKKNQLTK